MLLEELWKKASDENSMFGALLIDLSKAFDCMSHDLLIAKLDAYDLDSNAVYLVANYLKNRKQRTKIGKTFSSWHDIETGVPQGSILGPLLFNIYICDMLYSIDNINVANYADDTTPFATGTSWDEVREKLEKAAEIIFSWLAKNQMQGNAEKCQLIANDTNKNLFISVGNESVFNNKSAKILGVTFDNTLNFESHIKNICKTASQKVSALARMCPYLSISKKRKLMNAFFKCHFSYCPLIWMFHSRTLEHKINRLHERCLRLVFSDTTSSFKELLQMEGSINFHMKNLQLLAIELFKAKNNLSPSFTNEIFIRNENPINTRTNAYFRSRKVKSVLHGKQSLSFLGPKIWELVPQHLRELTNINQFKSEIKHWRPSACPCRNCRLYISGVGFIE